MTTAPLTPRTRTRPGKVMGATLLGTSIEWYDFAIYSMAAAVVIPQVFFPYLDPGSGILSSFATLAIASVARPAGALLFGWIGDTAGRRPALIGSMLVMTVATVGIGFIPGYASIGIMAPVLLVLLRVLQSLAVGGEWGGATSYAVEAAPPRWRAVFGAFPQMGNSLGIFLSSAVFTLAALPGQEFFLETGWRIPFWVAGGLGLIGLWLRFSIEESQEFLETKQNRIVNPHAQKARMRPGLLLLAAGAFLMPIAGIYIFMNYVQARAVQYVGYPTSEVTSSGTVVSIVMLLATIVTAVLADRTRIRLVLLIALAGHVAVAFPLFLLTDSGSYALLLLGMSLAGIFSAGAYGVVGTYVTSWFDTETRQRSISLAYQIAGVLGAFTPMAAQLLTNAAGTSWIPVAVLYVVLSVISFWCVASRREGPLVESDDDAARPASAPAR